MRARKYSRERQLMVCQPLRRIPIWIRGFTAKTARFCCYLLVISGIIEAKQRQRMAVSILKGFSFHWAF
jgi:hypothetical protein